MTKRFNKRTSPGSQRNLSQIRLCGAFLSPCFIRAGAERSNMKSLTVWFPIEPVPKGRPRFTKFGKAYTPKKTHDYEKKIADYFRQNPNRFKFEKGIPIVVNLVFGMPIPQSAPKSRNAAMLEELIKHTKKPDLDNLQKAVLDALNGIAWEDDSQIVRITAEKKYTDDPYVYLYMNEYTE